MNYQPHISCIWQKHSVTF